MALSALSFWQPYAWLIVNGHAEVDSRTWEPTEKRVGTRIVVHASKKKMTRADYDAFLVMMKDLKIKKYPQSAKEFDYGCFVGTVVVAEVTKSSRSYFAAPGYFHWRLERPRTMKPIPGIGQRGWFSAPASIA